MRALRRAGYDGVMLGRVLAGPRAAELLDLIRADSEAGHELLEGGRAVELIRTPPRVEPPSPEWLAAELTREPPAPGSEHAG